MSVKQGRPHISLIVAALLPDLGIGANGAMPWRLKQEMRYFKDITTTSSSGTINAVVMGRKTWELIPKKFRPLPGRLNIVLSRSFENDENNGVLQYNSISALMGALQELNYAWGEKKIERIFVMGGAQIYEKFLQESMADSVLLTEITNLGAEPIPMDTFLSWDQKTWTKATNEELETFARIPVATNPIVEGTLEYTYTMWIPQGV